ncbi:MAG: hypothetical protein MUF00_10330 [Gemmatimonadaceae bacterium]|jgi:hypothetical protein|nr:hypothetical protein [Gemmatimonadaceae bacterium]
MRPSRALLCCLTAILAACQTDTSHSPTGIEPTAPPVLNGGATSDWTATTLTLPAGVWTSSGARSIDDSGRVVGFVTVSGTKYRPVRWINGVPSFMVVPTSSHWAMPNAINRTGDAVVGQVQWISGNQSTPVQPARWFYPGTITTLSTLGHDGWAMDINSARIAVGTSRATSGGQQRAVKWSAAGTITNLHPAAATWSRAQGINEQGEVVGVVSLSGQVHGWKWNANNVGSDLGVVLNAEVPEINSTGEAIGTAVVNGISQAVMWTPNTTMLALGAGAGSIGTSVSEGRRYIGVNGLAAWTRRAGPVVTLPTASGAGSSFARDVNRCGRIVGHASGGSLTMQMPVLWSTASCDP